MKPMNEYPLLDDESGVPLFYPHVSSKAQAYVSKALASRWIGQGPRVDEFEEKLGENIDATGRVVAVSSGTAALHLAYLLAEISADDEVICPVFTCTATNIPLLYIGANIIFSDISTESLNIDVDNIERLITNKTKAISVVDYGGRPVDYQVLREICDRYKIKLIADLAHCLDAKISGQSVLKYVDFAIFSFQAIKTVTSADGGAIYIADNTMIQKAKRLRWFGIDRTEKQKGTWENDINEIGYKYQMNDIQAAIGLANLEDLQDIRSIRKSIFSTYQKCFEASGIKLFEATNEKIQFTPWLATIDTVGRRQIVMDHLRKHNIESAQVHYRNDRYSIFKQFIDKSFPNMDNIENNYLVLPLHTNMTVVDAEKISEIVIDTMADAV